MKSLGNETTDFQDKEIPMVGSNYSCLTVSIVDYDHKID